MSENQDNWLSAPEIASQLASALDAAGCEYAIGGALALGFWGAPRGTLDVDVTLFLPPNDVSACVNMLESVGCKFDPGLATRHLTEHGFCQVEFSGGRVDVFLPLIAFYEEARQRRRSVEFGPQTVQIWDAETLCVFKMMFFRLKDLADVEEVLRVQGPRLNREWVRTHIADIFGQRDPRLARWDELAGDASHPAEGTEP